MQKCYCAKRRGFFCRIVFNVDQSLVFVCLLENCLSAYDLFVKTAPFYIIAWNRRAANFVLQTITKIVNKTIRGIRTITSRDKTKIPTDINILQHFKMFCTWLVHYLCYFSRTIVTLILKKISDKYKSLSWNLYYFS